MGAKLHQSKGKQPRSQSKVPKFSVSDGSAFIGRGLSVKGGEMTWTIRRLA